MPYNFVADSFHTKKLCSILSSSEVRFHTEIGRFAFLTTFGCLEATYDDHHLRRIGKRVLGFLLLLDELLTRTENQLTFNRPTCYSRLILLISHLLPRNSSGDEIANVNFLYDDIVHVLQNTIDSCINSATDRAAVMCWNVCLPNSVK